MQRSRSTAPHRTAQQRRTFSNAQLFLSRLPTNRSLFRALSQPPNHCRDGAELLDKDAL